MWRIRAVSKASGTISNTSGTTSNTGSTTDQKVSPLSVQPAGRSGLCFPRLPRGRWNNFVPVLGVFFTALLLRVLYSCVLMEHRICHYGDAYNFLRSGSALLEAIVSSPSIPAFLEKLYKPQVVADHILTSMTSMNLTDRLLIDGPVFSGYLALTEWLVGVDPLHPVFDTYARQICFINSVVDALACVLVYLGGRLAFNRRVGLIAGLLYAFYPGAIINTQHCYSESFSCFVLAAWVAVTLAVTLRHRKSGLPDLTSWFSLGLVSALLMLVKPVFAILPALAACEIIGLRWLSRRSRPGDEPENTVADNRPRNPAAINDQLRSSTLPGANDRPGGLSLSPAIFAKAGLLLAGLMLILMPWMLFNKAATGQMTILVNRVPSYNIFHGNQMSTDGWRVYPYIGCFPGNTGAVVQAVLVDAAKEPAAFIALQMKKVARLWSGVWNEYHYALFGVPLEQQSLVHQLLLLLALPGALVAIAGSKYWRLSRPVQSGVLLLSIAVFHFVYLPFEAISRYAITAMPAVVILAAYMLARSMSKSSSRRLLVVLLICASITFTMLALSGQLSTWLSAWLPTAVVSLSPTIVWFAGALCTLVLTLLSCRLLAMEIPAARLRLVTGVVASAALLVTSVAFCYAHFSYDWREWRAPISGSLVAKQVIKLPCDLAGKQSGTAFLLLDLGSETLVPPVVATVNGTTLNDKAFPLAQLQSGNRDIILCLAIQGQGMGLDLRSFRHWWVIPVPAALLRAGQPNEVTVSAPPGQTITLYGDTIPEGEKANPPTDDGKTEDGTRFLPSLLSYSYTKGFTTFDYRDPRVFEPITVHGLTLQSSLSDRANENDLSVAAGKQSGAYRIRILVPITNTGERLPFVDLPQSLADQVIAGPFKFGSALKPFNIDGRDPSTFSPAGSPVALTCALAQGTRFYFTSRMRSVHGSSPAFVSLNFTGTNSSGSSVVWNSSWQPIGIQLSRTEWKTTSFGDIIPSDVLKLRDLRVSVLISPFQPDYLFLKRKEALKSAIQVQDASMVLLRPLPIPESAKRAWLVY